MELTTVEHFLRKRGMLKEGFNQFIIRGEFGEVDLGNLLHEFLQEQVALVDKQMALPNIQAKLPEGISVSEALEFKEKWIAAMKDTNGPIIINSQPDEEVKKLLICIVESARANKGMMEGMLGRVILKQAKKLYDDYNLGKPKKYDEEGS